MSKDENAAGYAQAMTEMGYATAEIEGAAKFLAEGLEAKDMDPLTLILHFLGELKKSPLSRDAALGIFAVSVFHLVESRNEVKRLQAELTHVCDFIESDGTTLGVCHLPGIHGGREPMTSDGEGSDDATE